MPNKFQIIFIAIFTLIGLIVFIVFSRLFLENKQIDGYHDCVHGQSGDCSYHSNNPLPQPIVWEPNETYYNSGKFGQNDILLKIRNEVRENIGFDQWQGDYIYPGISEASIHLEGQAKDDILELSEMYDINRQFVASKNKITIDLIGKTAIWSDGLSQYITILEPDTVENVEIGLLQKYKKLETQFFDLECMLEGMLQVGKCKVLNKEGLEKSQLEALGFPELKVLENSAQIIFDKKAYGLCTLKKYSIDVKTLDNSLISQETNC
jgi:hypothetical protein